MSGGKTWIKPVITAFRSGGLHKFGGTTRNVSRSDVDGIAFADLVRDYGSPLFVLSERRLRENYRRARDAFTARYPDVEFAWSYKTNYLGAVCNTFHQEGALAEVVSAFEYEKARSLGVPGDCIIFNGPHKKREILVRAIRENACIHIDHFDELHTLEELSNELALKARVALRLNFANQYTESWQRFGFNIESGEAMEAAWRIHNARYLHLQGLHSHIGTFVLEPRAYQVQAAAMCDFLLQVEARTESMIDYLDFGGGFASLNSLQGTYLPPDQVVPGIDQYAEAICETILEMTDGREAAGRSRPRLILESGRALVDDAGTLASTIIAGKRLPDGRRALIMDAGVNLLFTAFWYNHSVTPVSPVSGKPLETVIYGPMCMNIDVLRSSIMLPPVSTGGILLFSPAGAYNNTQWLQFIEYRPNVVMIDEQGNTHVIRHRETLETVTGPENMPDHLAHPFLQRKPRI